MRTITLQLDGAYIKIRINGNSITFSNVATQFVNYLPIEVLFSKEGIIKEYSDLKDKSDTEIKETGIIRFRDKISKMKDEKEIEVYVIDELVKFHGAVPKMIEKPGWRPQRYE